MKTVTKALSILILICLMLTGYVMFVGIPSWAVNPILAYQAEGLVKVKLAVPESAMFRNKVGMCGEVNSKNEVGGYTGYQRYVAGSKYTALDDNSDGFEDVWQFNCALTDRQRAEAFNKASKVRSVH